MKTREVIVYVVLPVVLAFLLPLPASGAPASVPDSYDIEGYYLVTCKEAGQFYSEVTTSRQTYPIIFRITRVTSNEVQLNWIDPESWGTYWTVRAHYMNGVLLVGRGDDTQEPADEAEAGVLEFSGAPGKIKLAGREIFYMTSYPHMETYSLKGKMMPLQ